MLVRLNGYYCNLIKRSSLFLWLLAWLTSIGIIFCEGLTLVNCVILFTFKILLISLLPPAKSFKSLPHFMKNSSAIKFSSQRADFFSTLNQRVNEYFKSNNISRYGNNQMRIKTVFMFTLFFAPYVLMLTETVTHGWAMFGLCILMGTGIAGIGLAVMHDANHGSYSNKSWINNFVGYSLNVMGAGAFNWKV